MSARDAAACCSKDQLVEYAEGLLAEPAAAEVLAHIDACADCRIVLAEIARAVEPTEMPATERALAHASTANASSDAATAPASDEVPAEFIADYLKRDAAQREMMAAKLVGTLAVVSILLVAFSGPELEFRGAMIAIQGVLLGYELIVWRALKRGWFASSLPLINSVIEVSSVFAMRLAVLLTGAAEQALRSPATLLLGALLVFTAIRAQPRISIVCGVVAGLEAAFLFTMAGVTGVSESPVGFLVAGGVLNGVFCVTAGVAGAVLARYLVGRAERALRELRERDLFGKYLLHDRIGVGGMGEVFVATYCPEGGFRKRVAVKRIRPDVSENTVFIDAFREEARISAMLTHPNVVQVHDFGRYSGAYMVAMEYVDGISLAALLRRLDAPLPPSAVSYLAAELATALDYVHNREGSDGAKLGLVHRDLNPPNVMLSQIGEVKLADFGLARAADKIELGTFSGKLEYAAPEQLRGERLDARADLYALGLTLREALTGRVPRESRASTPAHERELLVQASPELAALCLRLLEAERDARPANAAELRTALLALSGDLAPYPHGRDRLVASVKAALGERTSLA